MISASMHSSGLVIPASLGRHRKKSLEKRLPKRDTFISSERWMKILPILNKDLEKFMDAKIKATTKYDKEAMMADSSEDESVIESLRHHYRKADLGIYEYDSKTESTPTDEHSITHKNIQDEKHIQLNMALNLNEVLNTRNNTIMKGIGDKDRDDDSVQLFYRNKFIPKAKLNVVNKNTVVRLTFKTKLLKEKSYLKIRRRKIIKPTGKALKKQCRICGFLKLFEEEKR